MKPTLPLEILDDVLHQLKGERHSARPRLRAPLRLGCKAFRIAIDAQEDVHAVVTHSVNARQVLKRVQRSFPLQIRTPVVDFSALADGKALQEETEELTKIMNAFATTAAARPSLSPPWNRSDLCPAATTAPLHRNEHRS